ncbi:putative phage head-tail adaptor [compost metagenome]
MNIAAGALRHKVTIQRQQQVQNPATGSPMYTWVTVWDRVPASIEPLSARDFIAAQAVQSEVTARITIRHRAGVTASMRILHNGKVYNIRGVLADPDSGRAYLTLPCSEGVNDG